MTKLYFVLDWFRNLDCADATRSCAAFVDPVPPGTHDANYFLALQIFLAKIKWLSELLISALRNTLLSWLRKVGKYEQSTQTRPKVLWKTFAKGNPKFLHVGCVGSRTASSCG